MLLTLRLRDKDKGSVEPLFSCKLQRNTGAAPVPRCWQLVSVDVLMGLRCAPAVADAVSSLKQRG